MGPTERMEGLKYMMQLERKRKEKEKAITDLKTVYVLLSNNRRRALPGIGGGGVGRDQHKRLAT